MSGKWLGFVELLFVLGAGLLLGLRELRGLSRDRAAGERSTGPGTSAAARHAEGQQDLDPEPRETIER